MRLIILFSLLFILNCIYTPKLFKQTNKTISTRFNVTKCKNCWMQRIEKYEGDEEEGIEEEEHGEVDEKPVIYLYPEKPMDISVQLNFKKTKFTAIYPKFNEKNTWNVHAQPNGDIYIKKRKYPYLFWEADSYAEQETNEGFIVTDEEAEKFLEEKLTILGLNDNEKTDFITFWLPVLLRNKLSLCSFQSQKFFNNLELNVTPKPDSMIRVFLSIKKLDSPINVKEQKLVSVERKGFTLVEWGGCNLK